MVKLVHNISHKSMFGAPGKLTETNKTLIFTPFLKKTETEIHLFKIFSKYLDLVLLEFIYQMFI